MLVRVVSLLLQKAARSYLGLTWARLCWLTLCNYNQSHDTTVPRPRCLVALPNWFTGTRLVKHGIQTWGDQLGTTTTSWTSPRRRRLEKFVRSRCQPGQPQPKPLRIVNVFLGPAQGDSWFARSCTEGRRAAPLRVRRLRFSLSHSRRGV